MNDLYKIFRFILFLIPLGIMFIMSFFIGKKKAAAKYYRFKMGFGLFIFFVIFICMFLWTLYVLTIDKDKKDKDYIKIDLVVTLVFFIILLVYIYWWKYINKLSNNTVSRFQLLNTTTNALRTGRNMFM